MNPPLLAGLDSLVGDSVDVESTFVSDFDELVDEELFLLSLVVMSYSSVLLGSCLSISSATIVRQVLQ